MHFSTQPLAQNIELSSDMPHRPPTPTPSAAAQSLRARIGQENMTQSSVLATRRLDEALLRLDRAAGRSRDRDEVYEDQPRTPNRAQRSGLELDHSVSQNTSVWLETDDTAQQMRIDAEHASPRSAAPHAKLNPTSQSRSESSSDPAGCYPPAVQPQDPSFSADTFEAWFTQPIDVMILSTTARIASHRAEVKTAQPETVSAKIVSPSTEPLPAAETECEPAVSPASTQAESPEPIPRPEADAPAALQDFVAAWQVNEFVVPATIDQLFLAGSIAEQLASRLSAAREQGLRTIAITSTKPGEGRSTVAIGIALSVAFSGLRVALVDADRDGVDIASDLHLDLDHSWLDAIRDRLPLEEVAVCSLADAMTLLPLLKRSGKDKAPFEPHELRRCLAQLRKSFDIVIVDCGPSAIADVTLCDTCLIVRDVQRTKAAEVETLSLALRRSGSHGVGVIENFC